MKRHGFSLIELLVTIAVIVALMALLMPVMALVRSQAQSTHCASNLRQIGSAAATYASDWSGRLPIGQIRAPLRDDLRLRYWGMYFGFYETIPDMQTTTVFNCPTWISRKMVDALDWSSADWPVDRRNMAFYTTSYGTNGYAAWLCDTSARDLNFNMLKMPNPSLNVYVSERMGIWHDGELGSDVFIDPPYQNPPYVINAPGPNTAKAYEYNLRLSHRRRANSIFYDFHVGANTATDFVQTPGIWWNP